MTIKLRKSPQKENEKQISQIGDEKQENERINPKIRHPNERSSRNRENMKRKKLFLR